MDAHHCPAPREAGAGRERLAPAQRLTVQGALLSLDLASDWISEGDGGRATGLDVITVDLHPAQYLNLFFVMKRSREIPSRLKGFRASLGIGLRG